MTPSLYKIFRPLLFQMEPEAAHKLALKLGGIAAVSAIHSFLKEAVFRQPGPELSRIVMGLKFKSPVCIAAGLDKDCELVEVLSATGVGAIELGTVTPQPQAGNPAPRMFRIAEERSLINRLGFPSCGLKIFAERLARIANRNTVIGVNIGKNKDTPLETCESDYEECARGVSKLADYLTINVSSPNTPGLRALQTPEMLTRVIRAVQQGNTADRPIAVKISPDCTAEQVSELVDCCIAEKVAGIIATNTTLWRPDDFASKEAGGLSGALLKDRAKPTISAVCKRTGGTQVSVIGAGGVGSAEDAAELLGLGCSAVQIYSALVFEGPGLISRINRRIGSFNITN